MKNRQLLDRRRANIVRAIAENVDCLRRLGSIQPSWRSCRRTGRRLGPFFRLLYRKDGKQRCIYLGSDERLVQEVETALAEMQASLREQRELDRHKALARTSLRAQKRDLDRKLRALGLYLKGNEVRGWRFRLRTPGRKPSRGYNG